MPRARWRCVTHHPDPIVHCCVEVACTVQAAHQMISTWHPGLEIRRQNFFVLPEMSVRLTLFPYAHTQTA